MVYLLLHPQGYAQEADDKPSTSEENDHLILEEKYPSRQKHAWQSNELRFCWT